MKKGFFLLILGSIVALNPIARAADVREGLVSYWPFETVSGDNTTPDLSFANHFALNNLFAADLGPGIRGDAFSFDGTSQFLSIEHATSNGDTGLPIYSAGSYTAMMWVNGAPQTAKYLFTEASTTSNHRFCSCKPARPPRVTTNWTC